MSVFNDRTGEEKINHQGLKMIIDTYRGANKIKVRFEDGYVTEWDIYSRFKSGEISNPYFKDGELLTQKEMAKKKIGEIKKNSLGQEVEIIGFRNFDDIDVRIEDGTILNGVTYKEFKKRTLAGKELKSKIGETVVTANNGVQKLIAYNSYTDITVEFDDGTIREHVRYDYFRDGLLSRREWGTAAYNHLGEMTTNRQGLKAKIICFNSEKDILVKFGDGEVVRTTYAHFKNGTIKNPKINARHGMQVLTNGECVEARQGMILENKYGDLMKIVNYKYYDDIDVMFEDGTIVKSVSFNKFKKGTLKNPNRDYKKSASVAQNSASLDESVSAEDSTLDYTDEAKKFPLPESLDSNNIAEQPSERGGSSHIGEEVTSIYGEKMVLTGYRSSSDIEITFTDGSVRTGIKYSNFKRGCVANLKQANEAMQAASKIKESRTGASAINNKGYKMTILVYNSTRDMLVQFYDNTFLVCKCYFAFEKGQIRKPSLLCDDDEIPMGEESFSSDGEHMIIVGYNNPKEVLVKFDDGSLKPGVTYSDFKKGIVDKKNCYLAENSPCSTAPSKVTKDCPEVIPVVSDSSDNKQENTEVPASDTSVPTTFSNCTDLSISNPTISEVIPTSASTESIPIVPDQQKQALFDSAESFRLSAESLGTASDSVTIAVALLYKNAIRNYLKYAVDSISEDVRVLGTLARKQGIDVNPRDLAWVNDFDFSFEDELLKPNSEDLNILAGIVMGIRKQIISL